ncbi:PspC domain-containing protein [Homoserinibacter sp. GY 40078]|uniref:PspC domain-containing protein n=1 Tax=Homoserinibacter sp. GY 40078 TaxID=2603275 RepID=UPI0011CA2884|nr:PspC domain-containing protein [Homoserinibacter sp. GY 40078]TXK18528.1 PspC domain-containing protein [Homoserinibacter sp. GY 40078]
MASTTTPHDAADGADASGTPGATTTATPPNPAPSEAGFFTWIRSLGLSRRSGWLGGVCAGLADAIGIDPLIVRGVAIVLGVVGAPIALVYAIAWLLLPDAGGTIHAQELGHGRVTRAIPGIAAVFLVSFLPVTQGFWYTGALYWSDLGWGGAIGRTVWTGVLLVGAVLLVVWLARRASHDVGTTPATTDDRPDTIPTLPAGDTARSEAAAVVDSETASVAVATAPAAVATDATPVAQPATESLAEPGEPPAPPADADADELAAWKRSQDEWQRQRAVWAADQRRTDRERRQAEAHARAVEAAEAARERARIRRLTRPRASAGVVFLVLGIGLLASAAAALGASTSAGTRGAEWAIGASVLVLVLGAGTVIVALARRRSGALGFFSLLSVFGLLVALVIPTDRAGLPLGSYFAVDTNHDGNYWQLAGNTELYMTGNETGTTVDLWQYAGTVHVTVSPDAVVRIEYSAADSNGRVWVGQSSGGDYRTASYGVNDRLDLQVGEGEPDLVLRLWGGPWTTLAVDLSDDPDGFATLDPLPDQLRQSNSDGEVRFLDPESITSGTATEGVTP